MRRWAPLITLLAVALAGWLVYRILSRYSLEAILAAVREMPPQRLLLALLFAAGSYLCLTGFDWLGVRYAGRRLPYRKVALASFVSLSIGHNLGLAGLSSGAIRYRFYSRFGLGIIDVTRIVLFCGMTVGCGMLLAGCLALAVHPEVARRLVGLDPASVRWLVALGLMAVVSYPLLAAACRRPLRLGRWLLKLPRPGLALRQLVVGALNYLLVAACLHQVLGGTAAVGYLTVLTLYLAANLAVLMTHVPGGVGVIESVVLMALPGAPSVAALVMFRVLYFLLPLALGGVLFLGAELLRRRGGSAAG